jgi:hypothetical protein
MSPYGSLCDTLIPFLNFGSTEKFHSQSIKGMNIQFPLLRKNNRENSPLVGLSEAIGPFLADILLP